MPCNRPLPMYGQAGITFHNNLTEAKIASHFTQICCFYSLACTFDQTLGATDFSCHGHVANAIIVGVNTFLFLAVLARFSNIDFF